MIANANETKNEVYQSGTFTSVLVTVIGPDRSNTSWAPNLKGINLKLDVNQTEGGEYNSFSENMLALVTHSHSGDALLPSMFGFKSGTKWYATCEIILPCAIKLKDTDQMTLSCNNTSTDAVHFIAQRGIGYQYGRPFIKAKSMDNLQTTTKLPFGDHISRIVVTDAADSDTPKINNVTISSRFWTEEFNQYMLLAKAYTQTDASFISYSKASDMQPNVVATELPVAFTAVMHSGTPLMDVSVSLQKSGSVGEEQLVTVSGYVPVAPLIEKAAIKAQVHEKRNAQKVLAK